MKVYETFFIGILLLIFSPICVWIIDWIIDLIKNKNKKQKK